jgi:hypothetical protein
MLSSKVPVCNYAINPIAYLYLITLNSLYNGTLNMNILKSQWNFLYTFVCMYIRVATFLMNPRFVKCLKLLDKTAYL